MDAEILAPVGGQEQLLAAVRCGADAVYLGARGFNARANAENFEESSLAGTVAYCHSHGVRVHVTVNTLVRDDELPALEKTAEEIARAGADAVIVQDPAVMTLFLRRYPTLEVHASTQCAVHNRDGVRFYEDLGVKRVVLARELSLDEIAAIRAVTSVELEAFIHGALCMCLSGACYLSSMIGGRSGNRGRCAQPCRLDFRAGSKHYALSLKDMSHLAHLPALRAAGVCSFKIEGRMKRPEYVAAAVTAAREALRGEPYDEETLRAVFSRSGFTDGYATANRTAAMFGHREKEDVLAAEGVLAGLRKRYEKENPTVPVAMTLSLSETESRLTLSGLGTAVTVSAEGALPAKGQPTEEALAAKNLARLGGTPFLLDGLTVENPRGLMCPPSRLNALRREAAEALLLEAGRTRPHGREEYACPALAPHAPGESELWGRFSGVFQVQPGFARVILPIEELAAHPEAIGENVLGELPAVSFPDTEEKTRRLCEKLKEQGLRGLWTENIYGLRLGRALGLSVYGGGGLNILNSQSLAFFEAEGLAAATVSWELAMGKIRALRGALPRGLVVYGRLPLMRFRACPLRGEKGCGACPGGGSLTDRLGNRFPVICHGRRYQTLLNCVPLHLGGKQVAEVDFRLLYFTTETPEEVRRVTEELRANRESAAPRTGGLYYRQLL
ncbi:MAG: peptidase U32 family protein [bacterium]